MELRVHLKICEGCGCLWYRAQTQGSVYCNSCEEKLKDFPTPESRKRRGRPAPQDAGEGLGSGGSNRRCGMSAALQLPMIWSRAARSEHARQNRGDGKQNRLPAGGKASRQSAAAEPLVSLGFLPKAYGEPAAALPVRVHAGGQGAEHPGRPYRAGMVFQPPDPHLRGCGDLCSRCGEVPEQARFAGPDDAQPHRSPGVHPGRNGLLAGDGVRTVSYKFPTALDRLTEKLLESGLLVIPH